MSRVPKPGTRAPRAPGGPAARRVWSSDDRARRGAACGASSRGRCWVTRRYDRTRRVPPPAACASPKNHRSFPRAFRSRFGVRAARRPTGAVRRLSSRACLSARGRARTGGRANPLDPRTSAGGTRASAPPNAGGRRRPPRSSRRSPGKPGSRLVVLDACQTKHRVFRISKRAKKTNRPPSALFLASARFFFATDKTKPCYRRSLFTRS